MFYVLKRNNEFCFQKNEKEICKWTADAMCDFPLPKPAGELFCFYYWILLLPAFVMIVHKIKALIVSDDEEQF